MVEYSGSMSQLNRFFTWFSNLAYLNLLWVVSSLAGFILLGLAPSTSALFAVIRQLLRGEEKVPITKSFFHYYRQDFWRINGIFYALFILGAILFADMLFLFQMKTGFASFLFFFLSVVAIFYLLTCFFIFPVFVHFDLYFFAYFKQAFLLGITKPLYVLFIIAGLIVSYAMLTFLKTLFVFFGGSLGAFIVMAGCYHLFNQLNERVEKKTMQSKEGT